MTSADLLGSASGSQIGLVSRSIGDRMRSACLVVALLATITALFDAVAHVLPSWPLFWVITPLRLLLMVGLAALVMCRPTPRLFLTALDLPLLALVAMVGALSIQKGLGYSGWRGLLVLVGAYYLVVGLRRAWPEGIGGIQLGIALASAAAVLTGLSQAANQTPTGFCRNRLADVDCQAPGALVRVMGTFSNPILLASFLVLVLPLLAVTVWAFADGAARIIGYGAVGAGVLALFLTFSRGPMIGFAVAALVMMCTLADPASRAKRWVRPLSLVGLTFVVVGGVALGLNKRGQIWETAFSIAVHHPLGVGIDRAGEVISQQRGEEFAHAHNLVLNWFLEAGVVGLVAILAIMVLLWRRAHAIAHTRDPLGAALIAGLSGFGVLSIADHPANSSAVAIPLFVVMALVMTHPLDTSSRYGRHAAEH